MILFVRDNRQAPWHAGLQAAKANLVPGLFLQTLMLFLLLGYYFYPPVTEQLNRLSLLKLHWGYAYSAFSAIVAGALIPEIVRGFLLQKGKFTRHNATNLVFTIPFWCCMGILVDAFYRLQSLAFGNEPKIWVVFIKVACDQFLYSPLIATPLTCWLYDWKHAGYSINDISNWFSMNYVKSVMIPMVFANWGVWIPLVTILYSLPSNLQVPLFGLALSLWVLLLTWISEKRQRSNAKKPSEFNSEGFK